jgi:hypothetical protein
MNDEDYTSRRYGRQSNGGESKLRSLLRSRYPDYGNEADVRVIEDIAKDLEVGNSIPALVEFLDNLINRRCIAYAPATAEAIANAKRKYRDFRVSYTQPVRAALQEAKARYKDYNFNLETFERRVLSKVHELEWSTSSAQHIADVMESMIRDPNENVPLSFEGQLAERQRAEANRQAREAQTRADYINAMIQNICRGKAAYPVWSASHGKVINADSALLHNLARDGSPEAIAQLEAIDRETAALRQQRFDMNLDQQREVLHEASNANRVGFVDSRFTSDHKPKKVVGFDNRPRTIDLDREQPRPYSENPTDSPIRGRAVNASFSDEPSFISAVTGKEMTKAEAIALAKNNLAAFRDLSKKDRLRLNRILAG